jgi:hypothetical protein
MKRKVGDELLFLNLGKELMRKIIVEISVKKFPTRFREWYVGSVIYVISPILKR